MPRRRSYSGEELVSRLELVWRKMGRAPRAREMTRHANVSYWMYKTRWGSLRRACREVARWRKGLITREELLRVQGRALRRKEVPAAVRYSILERDRFRCTLCGASPAVDPSVRLEVDHIRPVSRGGGMQASNLRTTCAPCNRGKGARDARE
jgi:5-methylcytosine-specific restriction endonuclease McrA